MITTSASPACYKTSSQNATLMCHRTIASAPSGPDRLCFGKQDEPRRTIKKGPFALLLAALSLGGCAGLKTTPPTLDNIPPGGLVIKGKDMNPEQVKRCLTGISAIQDDLIAKGHAKGDTNINKSEYVCIPLPGGNDVKSKFKIKYNRY
ncbi:MAG TPA: hypothetical protein V6C52_10955 [Coleofasciculaceae cyanobacterium]